ncbi:translation protein [Aulographum hederae CBS 113979]|uniref:Large ribosomal subunit protein uL3m n=1 Tax=Aulographum hederae CBS 113979 TaxID=1176131 RepID=A0A6G1H481_9PEZI|nr:translation protein [Aulographum hederae CBS 113979]
MPPRPPARLGSSPFQCLNRPSTVLFPQSSKPLLPLVPTRGIKSIYQSIQRRSPRHNRFSRFNHKPGTPHPHAHRSSALNRKLDADVLPLRPGALALKSGMTALLDPVTGVRIPCTVLQLDRNQVLAHKTRKENGYDAVIIGAGSRQEQNVTRADLGKFEQAGVSIKRWIGEFRVRDSRGLVAVGTGIGANWWKEGLWVDVRGVSKGKGFAGGMKKWGWSGQPASHGNSLSHRVMGSSGGSQGSGSRVIPGKKMPGRMGGENHTIQNLLVLKVDKEAGIVVVKGCVAGAKGRIVRISDAIKKDWPDMTIPVMEKVAPEAAAAA